MFIQEEPGTEQECAGRGCGSLEPAWTGGRGLGLLSWARGQGRPGGCSPDPAASLDAGTALFPGRLKDPPWIPPLAGVWLLNREVRDNGVH